MDTKTFHTLELDKILIRLAGYAAFSASRDALEKLEPATALEEALYRQGETTEARLLLDEQPMITIGGARDVRDHARTAGRGGTLDISAMAEVKGTLEAALTLKKIIDRAADRCPRMARIAEGLYEGHAIIAAINRVIDERGEVKDTASPRLADIRIQARVTYDRLQAKLNGIVNSATYAPYLQEALVTQRNGRFVIPVKSGARGRIKGIVHDSSSSGATLFIEPLATVEMNNKIRELEIAEQDEIIRILAALSEIVGEAAEPIIWTVESITALDVAFAKAKYANAINAEPPVLVGFDPNRVPGITIQLYNARHPLLDPAVAVPIDVELVDDVYQLVITGPNTGGKTVSLKTVGLLTLMAQCGLHIPAHPHSVLTVFDNVLADIGDEQSIEQSLSTFSAHLRRIITILEQVDDRSLVILDELGSGTDPAEGAAIARAILNHLRNQGITTFVATHYPELKLYAHQTPGVRNASVEFDVETLSPTYRLIVGLPGRSNALLIASRLKLPEAIIEEAQSYVGESDLEADTLLDEIHRTRLELRESASRLRELEEKTYDAKAELDLRLVGIEEERAAIIKAARAEVRDEVNDLQAEIRDLRRQLSSMSPSQRAVVETRVEDVIALEKAAGVIESQVDTPVEKVVTPARKIDHLSETSPTPPDTLGVGDRVYLPTLQQEGEILSIAADGEADVSVGSLRVRVKVDSLEWRSTRERARTEGIQSGGISTPRPESPGLELHLRGYRVEDALPEMEDYLDRAYLAGLPWVRIVHGKGSGALRKAVQENLRSNSLVKSFEKAPGNEGGDGVTVVRFEGLS
jgi:DNA mismatch repair protein MutS2